MNPAARQQHNYESHTITGRMAAALTGRHWAVFVAELLLIVIGILIALTIDGWVEERENRQLERSYLGLLSRDLDLLDEQLQAYIQFESSVGQSGARVLSLLNTDAPAESAAELREQLSNMAARRTLRLVSAAYLDLTSTGHLQLIQSRSLRDSLLRYFAEVARVELIIEKNNTVFVDNLYFPFLMDQGITWWPSSMNSLGVELNDLDRRVQQRLGGNSVAIDSAFAQAVGAEFWEDVRRLTLMRIRATEAGRLLAESLVERTRELKSAIDQ